MKLDSESKKRIIRSIFEHGWNQQQFSSFSDFIGAEVIFNFRGGQQITNLEELKGLVAFWRKAFPDLTFQVLAVIVEQDLAAANLVFTGTHLGVWQDSQPTGQKIRVEEMMFFRFEEGKIVELWEVYDEAMLINKLRPVPTGDRAANHGA